MPFGQVMSYDVLRTVMIGFAKLKVFGGNHIITLPQAIHNADEIGS